MNEYTRSPETEEFLLQTGMHPDLIDLQRQTSLFRREMQRGLAGDSSSLPMLPTYLTTDGVLPADKPVLVIDAGGTNLRLARVTFHPQGDFEAEALVACPMPGSTGTLTLPEYLSRMTEILRPHLRGDDLIGYCFSYEARITPDRDGILSNFNKGVHVEGSDGMKVCEVLEKALADAGIPGKRRYVLLNDSTAAAFGAISQLTASSCSGMIGFILGTGTNTCYPEKTSRIKHYPVEDGGGTMLINMESGAYAGFPRGEADRLLDESDPLPGNHLYEKMVSGVYMGKLIRLATGSAAERGLFSPVFRERLAAAGNFRAVDADAFVREPKGDNLLSGLCSSENDRQVLLNIVYRLYERAAKLVSVNLTAVMEEAGLGKDPLRPALIAAEGSSFWKSALFLPMLTKILEHFAKEERGLSYTVTAVPSANLIGSAAAALLNA